MKPVSQRRWTTRGDDPEGVDRLVKDACLPPLVARLLVNRGICDAESALRFLSPSLADIENPFVMEGMHKAAARLVEAVVNSERICVYGDYDADGVTSVALLVGFFRAVGGDCFYYIPNRIQEGYGLGEEGVRTAAAGGAKVIVTVDCGITAVAEAGVCSLLGIDLIITDHHAPPERLPDALAILNPLQGNCLFPFKGLAGVGVAFFLSVAVRSSLREAGWFHDRPEPNLRQFLDLVAIGTVADVVPLLGQNRTLVRFGLEELTSGKRTGIAALKAAAGVVGAVDCADIGFRLAPRLNAAGRLEDAAVGVELLLCSDPDRAAGIAAQLEVSNAERQALEQDVLNDVLMRIRENPDLAGRKSIVLASGEWHPGVVGIVASRIVDLYHRPTVLIAMKDGSGRGSGRSIPDFHLYDALKACTDHLVRFGGHKYAAGVVVDEETLEQFVRMFESVAEGILRPEDLTPRLTLDGFVGAEDLTFETAEAIAALQPFGTGNPTPVLAFHGARIDEKRILNERHLKLKLLFNDLALDAVGFGMASALPSGSTVDVAFSLDINVWNGRRALQVRLRDLRNHSERRPEVTGGTSAKPEIPASGTSPVGEAR